MTHPPRATPWRKSSYSGGGQGDACVEVANHSGHMAVRDSKTPAGVILIFPTAAFAAFVGALKEIDGNPSDM
ncbi:DUF397 domain-containing protein [Streptomyces sp. NPDC093252]|uniref:DUF397 domain-containing protein n=1 Tax=Streptomyces sp. NPDC093252 TaxID=3154980 RepID=UPI00342F460E